MEAHKKNYLVYFYGYFASTLLVVYVNAYFPVYFAAVLSVDLTQLAFVQIFAYSALLVKPFASYYLDKNEPKKKVYLLVFSSLTVVSFVLLVVNLDLLVLFGVFLGFTLAAISIVDVVVDKLVVSNSPSGPILNNNILISQLGAMTGNVAATALYLTTVIDAYSASMWMY